MSCGNISVLAILHTFAAPVLPHIFIRSYHRGNTLFVMTLLFIRREYCSNECCSQLCALSSHTLQSVLFSCFSSLLKRLQPGFQILIEFSISSFADSRDSCWTPDVLQLLLLLLNRHAAFVVNKDLMFPPSFRAEQLSKLLPQAGCVAATSSSDFWEAFYHSPP